MNKTRVKYIRQILEDLYGKDAVTKKRGLSLVDVGCGGGLATESLARMGLKVLGIDASHENIAIASIHAQNDPMLSNNLEYRQVTAEQLVSESVNSGRDGVFDAVVSLEVIEHVNDPLSFVQSLVNLAKPNAPIFISTINRTILSFMVDILVPEYILRVIPSGTHDFQKFITPDELSIMITNSGANTLDTRGLILNPIFNNCYLSPKHFDLLPDAGVQANYILVARKK
ncbi:ubiquinone biosynthesis O-methyltransferase [Coemansia reversa NRRL 1564]|uniref:Ubiquinone biosynthesis O-methyltransferase n=1 Tax=Coemansia reversa (strain ATCC 12441 / NRRL 1564) TaxID=763665 RepID=A0A2G5B1N6_COERN|nr:ubiquinone biosynthesis O-methyltransferase [Coemansia reversa NRRL 1564]|eukprot:PIA12914.1 ubiquinone biosynthesis O-methyltransferase [Coemansia reversa NRRL 1564]